MVRAVIFSQIQVIFNVLAVFPSILDFVQVNDVLIKIFNLLYFNLFNVRKFNGLSDETFFRNVSVLSFSKACVHVSFFTKSLERLINTT